MCCSTEIPSTSGLYDVTFNPSLEEIQRIFATSDSSTLQAKPKKDHLPCLSDETSFNRMPEGEIVVDVNGNWDFPGYALHRHH